MLVRSRAIPPAGRAFKSCGAMPQVLVVDDDPMCLKVVSSMLQRCTYQGARLTMNCKEAGTGQAGQLSLPVRPLATPASRPSP